MRGRPRSTRSAFTLLEILLVIGILASLAALVLPNLLKDLEQARLPESARQLRSLVQLTRAHAMYDGKRYRIRFPENDEIDNEGGDRQPLVEREDDPLLEPEVFHRVQSVWTEGATLLRNIRCIEVRLGKPTVEELMSGDTEEHDRLVAELGPDVNEIRPPLYIEPDGTSEWATFVVTNAPPDAGDRAEELDEQYEQIEVILDGFTGLAWLQRPFYDAELEMLAANNWPPVLRRDFLSPRLLTEADVIEIQETLIRKPR
jgi:prepilin-type N-terminal cleavage/methylation domain-containing protein